MPVHPYQAATSAPLDGPTSGMLHGFLNLPATIEPVDRALALMSEVVAS